MKPLKCFIIDDEELAIELLKTYVKKVGFLELVATAENPIEALPLLKNQAIDLLFLDIQMPEIKGTEFAKMVDPNTRIIFTTAYSEYALEGFELNALDYLLKPITFERFLVAVNKAKSYTLAIDAYITVKSGYDLHKLKLTEIIYIESDSEYVVFHTPDKRIMSHQSLKSLEEKLPASLFTRVHRSFIVNKKKVTALKGRDLLLSNSTIPVSASYYEAVKNLF